MIDLHGTPYSLTSAAVDGLDASLRDLAGRVDLLRGSGKLTPQTLAIYYGNTRFLQIAESNAMEGSTLSVGDTELAVLKGITISGHDPGYSRDAQSLARALARLAELARIKKPVDLLEVKELHGLILEGRPGAGAFRNEEIRISGSAHRPPRTWAEVMERMEHWEAWSTANATAPAPLRTTILHAWLAHIHPFIDGNGRTARAVTNLELIRAGYPPVIIRARKDRSRYLEALSTSDEAGDLSLLLELILDRTEDALRDLERAAVEGQSFDPLQERLRRAQAGQLAIWNDAIPLLSQMIAFQLDQRLQGANGHAKVQPIRDSLELEDYITLCEGHPISKSWAFRLSCEVAGLPPVDRLAWAGFRSRAMKEELPAGIAAAPSLFWSLRNPQQYPPWLQASGTQAPGGEEITLVGDRWQARRGAKVESLSSMELASRIADEIASGLLAKP